LSTADFIRPHASLKEPPGLDEGARTERKEPEPWIFPARGIAVRIFFTCWLVYAIHLATNTVREIFPAITIADHLSFRVDEYANMHSDLFEMPGFGWHINSNPGASLLATVPYLLSKPVVDRIVSAVNRSRASSGAKEPPQYNSPWPMAQEFYREAWRRGVDVKLGLAAIVTQVFCMAPFSALGVVAMFCLLRRLFGSDRAAFWLSLLYAFGTPVFYRAGILNHNMIMGHVAFLGFLVLWNPGRNTRWSDQARYFAGGLAGGLSLLLDYSGVLLLGALFLYGLWKAGKVALPSWVRFSGYYALGCIGPILLLWFYQWQSFGNAFLPAQHWCPPTPPEAIHIGYRGFTGPQPHLVAHLLFDYRYGLFVTCPLLLLALLAPWYNRGRNRLIPAPEFAALLLIPLSLLLFFGGLLYVEHQYNFGLRYLAPVLPFLFVPTAMVLVRLPRHLACCASLAAVAQAWSMSMYRDVERGLGVLDTILHVFIGGLQLPALTVFSRMSGTYGDYASGGVSPLPIFLLAAALIYVIWYRPLTRPNSR
jgi:hypothetical protein